MIGYGHIVMCVYPHSGLVLPASPFLSVPGGITATSVPKGKSLLLTSWSLLSDSVHCGGRIILSDYQLNKIKNYRFCLDHTKNYGVTEATPHHLMAVLKITFFG
jgi:hypothetical protein